MVVLAIIVVLALIALPGVPDKMIRDRIVESVKLADIVKPKVADAWSATGKLPVDNAAAGPAGRRQDRQRVHQLGRDRVGRDPGHLRQPRQRRDPGQGAEPASRRDRGRAHRSGLLGVRQRRAAEQDDGEGPQQDRRAGALPAAQLPRPRGRLGAAVIEFDASRLDSASLRSAGKELLSLALIDARNHTLRWATALEAAADGAALALPADLACDARRRARPGALDARPHRLVPGILDRSQRAARARRARRSDASAPGVDRSRGRRLVRPGRDRPVAPARSRDQRAARPAGDARVPGRHARDDARAARRHRRRGRRLALLPSPRALPRGDARRGVRGAGADARHRRQGRAGGAHHDAAAAAAAATFRRRAGCSARAAPAFASTTRPSRIRSTFRSSRSTRKP